MLLKPLSKYLTLEASVAFVLLITVSSLDFFLSRSQNQELVNLGQTRRILRSHDQQNASTQV